MRQIQLELRDETKKLSEENNYWSMEINRLQDIYNHSFKFWQKIRRMRGGGHRT